MALIRQSAFQEVKGFDEGFFMYGDDVDLCFRLRARGYRLLVTTRTNAWHRHHELLQEAAKITTPLELCYVNRSRIYFVKKHGRPGDWRKVTARLIWAGVRPTARYLYRRVPELALAYWMGIWYGATSRMGKRMFAR
jgi:GT2 family glycosyltransferase